jgi:ketosteroid isomerase-like protein
MPEESTTPDLVESVRVMFGAVARGDFDTFLSFYAPDAVLDAVEVGETFEGLAAIRGFLEDWFGNYEEYEVEPEEILDLGGGVVFAVTREGGRPAGSPGRVEQRVAFVIEWVGGMVARFTADYDINRTRAAAERLAEERG